MSLTVQCHFQAHVLKVMQIHTYIKALLKDSSLGNRNERRRSPLYIALHLGS